MRQQLGEERKNYALHLGNCQLLHPQKLRSPSKPEKYEMRREESHRGKKSKSGGSDPTFLRPSRPKVSWGRSRPAARRIVPAFFHVDRVSEEDHKPEGGTACRSLRKRRAL